MRKGKSTRLLGLVIVVFLISFLSAPIASAHFLGYSAVDNGEIRYGGSTQYPTAQDFSIDTWNDLGEVNIAPDTIWTIEDLTYSDYYDSGTTTAGYYDYNPIGSDDLKLNEYHMDSFSSDKKKNVALHELGHALGLAHSYYPNIMYGYVTSITQLGSHDKEDYNSLY